MKQSLIPDTRERLTYVGAIIFIGILTMIGLNPDLIDDSAFTTFIGMVSGGTLVAAYSFYFGSSKGGSDTAAKMTDAVTGNPSATPNSTTTSTTNSTTATSTSTVTPAVGDPSAALAAIASATSQTALSAWKAANPSAMGLAGVEQAYNQKWDSLT